MANAKVKSVNYETRVGDLHDLRAFALASDLRSLGGVAAVTGESKATISRRITRLESELGTTLLHRSSRGIEPTDEGIAYRIRVGEVLEMLGDANAAAVHGGRATPSGQLRLTVPPGYAGALATHLAAFGAKHPEVVLVVHVSSRLVDVEAEHFDVALRATAKLADSSRKVVSLGDPQPDGIVVGAPSYLEGRSPPRRPHDLAGHRILGIGDTGANTFIPLLKRSTGETVDLRLPIAVAGSDLGFLKDMALNGAGLTVLPRLGVQREVDEGRLVHVLPSWVWPTVGIFLLYRGGPFVAPKVRAFVDFMRNALSLHKTQRGVS